MVEATEQRALSAFVRRLQLRSDLSKEEQQAILDVPAYAREIKPHREVARAGNITNRSCLVASGLLARLDRMTDGSKAHTALHIRGDMCDLQRLMLPVADWSIVALSSVVVVDVPHDGLRALIAHYPAIASAFWRDTAVDAAISAKWVANLSRKSALARVAHLLCEMGMRLESAQLGSRKDYALDATQEQLSDTLGLTSVHLNRVFRSLREARAVDVRARHVRVLNSDLLASIGEFDPGFLSLDKESWL